METINEASSPSASNRLSSTVGLPSVFQQTPFEVRFIPVSSIPSSLTRQEKRFRASLSAISSDSSGSPYKTVLKLPVWLVSRSTPLPAYIQYSYDLSGSNPSSSILSLPEDRESGQATSEACTRSPGVHQLNPASFTDICSVRLPLN